MRAFRLLTLRRLRQAPMRAIIAIVAVAAGVTLAVAILVTQASVAESVDAYGRALGGPAPLRVVGATPRAGLQQSSVDAARQVEGVALVVPMVQVTTEIDYYVPGTSGVAGSTVGSRALLVLGVDCSAVGLITDCDDALLASAGQPLAIGPGIGYPELDTSMRTDTGRVSLEGVPVVEELEALNEGAVVILPLAFAQERFVQPGLVDVAYVQLDDGADVGSVRAALEDAVGPQNGVLANDESPPELEVTLDAILPLFSLLGLFGLGTGAVLVRNTVALSLEERRRQLAITAAVGGDRRTLIGAAIAEAAMLGLVGGFVGIAGGVLVGGPIVDGISEFTEAVAGLHLDVHVPPSVVVIGALLGSVVAALSAIGPARRAARLDVAAELSGRGGVEEERPIRLVRRWLIWSGASLGFGFLCWLSQYDGGIEPWQATIGPLAFLGVTVSLLLSGAAAAPMIIGWLGRRLGRRRGATTLLALAELARDPRRAGVMAVAIASPILTGFATEGFVSSARASIESAFDERPVGVSVSTLDVNEGGGDAFVPVEAREALAALPGVAAVERGIFVAAGQEAGELVGVVTADGIDLEDFDYIRGSADAGGFAAGNALIGPALARRTGARVGDTVTVPTPEGLVDLSVQAIVESGDAAGYVVILHPDRFVELYGERPPAWLNLRTAEGVSEEELAATVLRARGDIEPELQVLTTEQLVAEIVESVDARMLPFRVMQQSLLLVAFVAVLSTLLLVGLQRRREHGLLAAVGADPGSMGRIVGAQAGLVSLVAVVISALAAPVVLWTMLQVIPLLIGARNPFNPDWVAFAGASIGAVVVTLLAAAWPAWRAGRVEVLEALRYE